MRALRRSYPEPAGAGGPYPRGQIAGLFGLASRGTLSLGRATERLAPLQPPVLAGASEAVIREFE